MCENIAGALLLVFMLATAALAGGPWAGIQPSTLPMVGQPVFMHPESGWSAAVLDDQEPGRVRLFIGHDDDEARAWIDVQRGLRPSPPPAFPVGEQGYGNGYSFILARDGNVVVLVDRPSGAAQDLATRILEQLEASQRWPKTPKLRFEQGVAAIDGDWAQVTFMASPTLDPKTFMPSPVPVMPIDSRSAVIGGAPRQLKVVAWDRFGRSVEALWVSDDAPASSPRQGDPAPTASEPPSP